MILRDYQQKGIADIRQTYYRGYKAPLYVLPTGGGKTVVLASICKSAVEKAKPSRILIIVHRENLLKQTAEKLRAFGINCGIVSPKYAPNYSALVQVAMVQTIVNRLRFFPFFDLIITDEAHHAVAGNYVVVQRQYPEAYQLGVTATPVRGDGLGLGVNAGGPFDALVLGPTVKELIGQGHLVQPVIYAPETALDLSAVHMSMGDYNKKEIETIVNKPSITGNAVEYYQSYCKHDPAVAFCISVKHAETVAADFRASGYKFYSVDGKTDDVTRDKMFKALADGSIHGITSCDLISEGTDIPAIAGAFLLRPTQSTGLYLQQVGRALRPSSGKEKALIFDHVGNFREHGFPEDDRQWDLDGEKKTRKKKEDKEKIPAVVWCEQCYSVHQSFLKKCPNCGFERIIVGREVKEVEGRLVELGEAEKQAVRRKVDPVIAKARTLQELERVAEQRGYKPGWAKHMADAREKKRLQNQ